MSQVLLIALGGAFGAVGRYVVGTVLHGIFGHGFPYGTLMVNTLGCLFMGFFGYVLYERIASSMELRSLLLVGFLGAFTTFSAFSQETVALVERGQWFLAGFNILANVFGGLTAILTGVYLGRILT